MQNFDFKQQSLTCKIADLGFAKELASGQLTDTYCGTAEYQAPESLNEIPYTANADIWSIGCIFYELLVGDIPFTSRTYLELYKKLRDGFFTLPQTVKLSVKGVRFMLSCLTYNPIERLSVANFVNHPYLANHSGVYDIKGAKLSFIGDTYAKTEHQKYLKDPFDWCRNN